MKKPLFFLFLLTSSYLLSQKTFPLVTAEYIRGGEIQIPQEFKGKYCLIGVASGKKSEEDLRTWQTPIYNKFIAKTGLMDKMYDVEICFLPLFTGAMKVTKNKVIQKLKENNEKLVLDHVYVYIGDKKPLQTLGADDKKKPYFYLLDPSGKIVWKGSGSFRQSYFDEMEEILSQ